MKNKLIKLIVVITVMAMLLTACGPSQQKTTTPDVAANADTTTTTTTTTESETTTTEEETTTTTEKEREYIADIELTRMDETKVKLSELVDKTTIVVCWATWCGYCVWEMPILEKVQKLNPDVKVVMVNFDDGLKDVQEFAEEENETNLELFWDETADITNSVKIPGFPTLIFITDELEIMQVVPGAIEQGDFRDILGEIEDFRKERGDFDE